jgi:hypothetical protein
MEDRHLAYVAKLENLTSLFLVGSPRITNVGLRHVENMDKLWDLIVVGCRGIKNAEQVISMPRLVAKVREGLAALESQGVRFGRSTGS